MSCAGSVPVKTAACSLVALLELTTVADAGPGLLLSVRPTTSTMGMVQMPEQLVLLDRSCAKGNLPETQHDCEFAWQSEHQGGELLLQHTLHDQRPKTKMQEYLHVLQIASQVGQRAWHMRV